MIFSLNLLRLSVYICEYKSAAIETHRVLNQLGMQMRQGSRLRRCQFCHQGRFSWPGGTPPPLPSDCTLCHQEAEAGNATPEETQEASNQGPA